MLPLPLRGTYLSLPTSPCLYVAKMGKIDIF